MKHLILVAMLVSVFFVGDIPKVAQSGESKRLPLSESWLEERTERYQDGTIQYTVKVFAEGRPEVRHGRLLRYRGSGHLFTETWYFLDQPHGPSRTWYEDGKQLQYEAFYVDGKLHGLQRSWWPNGNLSLQRDCFSGRHVGTATTWYDDGKKESEHTYSKDGKEVSIKSYHKNGTKRMEGRCVGPLLNQKEGGWKEWDENGKLIVDKYYKDGKEVPEPKDK